MLPLNSELQIHHQTRNTSSHRWNVNGTAVIDNSSFPGVVYITNWKVSNGFVQWVLIYIGCDQANNTHIYSYSPNGSNIINGTEYNFVLQGMSLECILNLLHS